MEVNINTITTIAELSTPHVPKNLGCGIEFSTGIMVPIPSIAKSTVLKKDGIPTNPYK